ncbi:MAG: hemolysin family protein [Caldiserica bacterium]|jgi:putative hemolysin|nr:hemolysin family protein [Caldisericota bacterium]MDH7561916.1 hemolysin family protein [Caldisericota bacterium]
MKEVSLLILLGLSAFFSASETAFFTLMGTSPVRPKGLAGKLLESPIRFLSFILLGNNLVNIAFSSIGTLIILSYFPEQGLFVGTLVLTTIIILFGEILPKTIAVASFKKVTPLLAPPLYFFSRLLMPASSLFYLLSEKTLELVFKKKGEKKEPPSSDELELLVEEGVKEGLLLKEEKEIFKGILRLSGKTAGEVMQPRPKVVALPVEANPEDAFETIQKSGVSRLPLYQSSLDEIKGILYVKDLLQAKYQGRKFSLKELMKPPLFVPEGISLERLIGEFRRIRTHIAVVVDEYGGTSGIVTLEDILEEIVGEIWDEYDKVKMKGIKAGPRTFICSGEIERDELEKLGIEIPEYFNNLSSFLIEISGRILQAGEKITYNGWEFTVLASKPNKIETVRVEPWGN